MSKIIKSFWLKLKDKFGKKVYNPQMTNLKMVKLYDTVELNKSKLNPLIKGFLIDESKGEHEQINSNSNILYDNENTKILNTIFNCPENYNTWYDYLKKYFFGNPLKGNKLSKNQNAAEKKTNLIFNCTGKLMAFINNEGDLIITRIETNNSFCIKSNSISNDGICTFCWDSINPLKIFYSSKNILYESLLNLDENKLFINRYYILNSNNLINCFPSPKGDMLILLYKSKIEIYDIFHKIIYSKKFMTFNFTNALYDNKSSLFITFTENDIILFNLKNFEFFTLSDFPGKIIKIISNPEKDNIYIFILNENNKLFMYILTDIRLAADTNLNFNSYQNSDSFYRHQNFVIRPEIYGFQYKLFNCNTKILDINISPKEDRIGILYEEQLMDNNKQNSLYIFGINIDQRDNSIEKILPLYNFGHFEESNICSFGFDKFIDKGNSFIIVRLNDDKFIKTNNLVGKK